MSMIYRQKEVKLSFSYDRLTYILSPRRKVIGTPANDPELADYPITMCSAGLSSIQPIKKSLSGVCF